MNNKKYLRILQFFAVLISIIFTFSGCYSVFSGGTGGLVVDKESTSTPKQGIANVDVYAYLSGSERDSDFASWKEGTVFYPKAEIRCGSAAVFVTKRKFKKIEKRA